MSPRAFALVALVMVGCATAARREDHCLPSQTCWPTAADWAGLASGLTGKLVAPEAPTGSKNPFELEAQPGATQSVGWLGAWTAARSVYAVAAENAQDVVAAVQFAQRHRLRLVIKGTGHDYLGRSNAADSLLIWTHEMRQITVHDSFVALGCPTTQAGVPAVSLGAGTRWLEAYQEVTVKHGRYVQGGGCTSVGAVGGFLQGGGFGSWSKKFGTGAAGMLEAEVVTADGKILVANACQNQDLFWALRGGGGGTFGVVTRATLMTHPLPETFGVVAGSITAKSDDAFRELLEAFLVFYGQHLNNESWGEQVRVGGDNSLRLSMTFQGLTSETAEQTWAPFRAYVEQHPDKLAMKIQAMALPARELWNIDFLKQHAPQLIQSDGKLFWWAGNQGEVATYWYAYQSRWLPVGMFEGAGVKKLAGALFEASRHWGVELHFNKGLAGASAEATARVKETAMNPAVLRAAGLAIIAANGAESDPVEAERARAGVTAAMKILRDATPGAGAYVNETDYFEPDWQQTFWGENYARLLEIKRRVDPTGLFTCHHCVGSERP